ncbi:flagellar hook protein FlgE [Jiella pacifica]|uniref:Flagellar hook protein FlgE n=1 Tax=Jiella pacifica TaxID=2696469 RepID=A0A6N9T500_9HYPH|nr:flagellar hook protein FlgE [Jiella pacifica]NDW04879.1 flagellar hook-basal body complex protein [Jiella pacifica]
MSINGVFRTSVSGMNAQANRLSAISDNIGNANTDGYKRSETEFSSLIFAQSDGQYNSGSVTTQVRQTISQQGSTATTSSATDVAIQGDGFFVVQDANGRDFYTRAGSFVEKTQNVGGTETTYLVNTAGYRLTGTSLTDGTTGPIELPVGKLIAPKKTESAEFSLQLPSSATAVASGTAPTATSPADTAFTKKTSQVVYNQLGEARTLDIYITKTADSPANATDDWTVSIFDQAQSTNGGFPYAATSPETLVEYSLDVSFDPVTGLPTTPVGAQSLTLADGSSMDLDFKSLTQYGTDFSAKVTPDGNPAGFISEFKISDEGIVNGIMSTGDTVPLYQINLATFSSPDRLSAGVGNVYSANANSGAAVAGIPGVNGFGSLKSNAIEQSNVDLATELTDMIESQRSYSANSKVFQTGSEILDVIINLKR